MKKINLWIYLPAVLAMYLIFATIYCYAGEVDTTKAVIHHTVSHDVSADTINDWHIERGFDEIGYNYVIRANGDIESGRSLEKRGAHAKGRNEYIGIVLTGYDSFTQAQLKALRELIRENGITHIERHHEQCPGEGIDIEKIQEEINK